MNISWIEEIYNNTNHTFIMWSTDAEHNGTFDDFDTGKNLGDNDSGHLFIIKPGARIKAHWCGIPWYHNGTRYRIITQKTGEKIKKEKFGLRLHQSETDKNDGVRFIDFRTNEDIGYIAFPSPGDRQFALIISGNADDISFELKNRQTKTSKQEIVKVLTQFGKDVYNDAREIIRKAAGQAVLGKLP